MKKAKKIGTKKLKPRTPTSSKDVLKNLLKRSFRKSRGLLYKTHLGKVELLDPKKPWEGTILEGLAAEFWLRLDGEKTVGELADELASENSFSVVEVREFIRQTFLDLWSAKVIAPK